MAWAFQSFYFTPKPPIVEARQYEASDPREQEYIKGWLAGRLDNPYIVLTPDTTGDGFTIDSDPGSADPFSIHVVPGDWILMDQFAPVVTTLDDIHERYMPVGKTNP
jgi:hypothetical protein